MKIRTATGWRDAGPGSAISAGLSGGQLEPAIPNFRCTRGHSTERLFLAFNGLVRCRTCRLEEQRRAAAVRRERGRK